MRKALKKRSKCTILYATEMGKSEKFAKNLTSIFGQSFDAKVLMIIN
jgi:nitric-oxide synthase